jgi:3-hydroxyacyl-CoA dehydrogenase
MPEGMGLTHEMLARAAARSGGRCIIASTPSALPLQGTADRLVHPERFLGLRHLHPADR